MLLLQPFLRLYLVHAYPAHLNPRRCIHGASNYSIIAPQASGMRVIVYHALGLGRVSPLIAPYVNLDPASPGLGPACMMKLCEIHSYDMYNDGEGDWLTTLECSRTTTMDRGTTMRTVEHLKRGETTVAHLWRTTWQGGSVAQAPDHRVIFFPFWSKVAVASLRSTTLGLESRP